jgi:cobalt-zinc-cadmium resistance protein CzcA
VVSQHGRPDNGSDASPFSNVEIFAPLKPFEDWPPNLTKEELTKELQKEFSEELPGIGFNFSQYIQDNVEEALSGVKGANSVKVVGPSLEVLEQLGKQVMAEMAKVRGVEDLGIFHVLGQPNLNIKVDREKAARYGLNAGDVNTVVQAAMGGTNATTVLEADRQFALAVRLDPQYRTSIDAIRTVKVAYSTPSGTNAYIPLSLLADITLDTGASFIYRESTQRYIPIKFSVRGRDLGSTVAEAQERVANAVKLPNGYRILWAGEFEDLQSATQRLMIVIPITLLLIMVLLYGLFNTVRDSLLALAWISEGANKSRCSPAGERPARVRP